MPLVAEPIAEQDGLEPPDIPLAAEIGRNPLEASPTQTTEVETEESNEAVETPAIPDETASLPPNPFAEELPPDFWGNDIELPDAPQASRQTAEATYEDAAPSLQTPLKTSATDTSAEGIEADPRFNLLQSLFPGFISDWQPTQTPAASPEGALEDAPEVPETVDLEEGLDADESDEES